MALFGKKKTGSTSKAPSKQDKKTQKTEKISAPVSISSSTVHSDVIIRPRITEKSGILSQQGIYTFEVTKTANKAMIAQAVRAAFKVSPVKVAIVNLPAKNVFVRGRRGVVSGKRKAVVTLKKGDKIDFV
jgi:large subunit ribosomal protein L23